MNREMFIGGDVQDQLKNSIMSLVDKTLILCCFLNKGSLDQIGQSSFNASANIGISLSWINCSALDLKEIANSSGIILMKFFNSSNTSSIFSKDNLEYFEIEDLILNNSFQQCSGEYNSILKNCELIIMNLTGLFLKKDINTFVSTTNFIYQPSFLSFFHALSFASLPSLRQSSSVNLEFSSILSNFLSKSSLLTFSVKNLLTDSEIFNSGNCSNCFFKSSGMDKVIFGIFIPPLNSVYSVEGTELYKSFDSGNSGAILKATGQNPSSRDSSRESTCLEFLENGTQLSLSEEKAPIAGLNLDFDSGKSFCVDIFEFLGSESSEGRICGGGSRLREWEFVDGL